ncbi:AAEL000877-PA [Aedes aegypti]|uniref:AAEL000877-PA n=1 Tax=Aedes aegypti TaxID=7159 RepID=Q17MZ9_AEDAE|nr:AAEL000877-PA [Aedes aegypti]
MTFGDYPAEYNPKIHGPYDPVHYYGKPGTPGEVLNGYLVRQRDKNPAAAGAVSRAFWRWQHKYWKPKRMGIAPFFQVIVGGMVFSYAINCGKRKHHRNYKYH